MKYIRVIVIAVAVIVAGAVAIAGFRAREPRYQGRTLSEWIDEADRAAHISWNINSASHEQLEADPDWQAARHAVKQMAPEAIPFLLDWVQAEDSPQKAKAIDWINEHGPFHSRMLSDSDSWSKASLCFWLLGNEAKPAWPALVQLTCSKNRRRQQHGLYWLVASDADKATMLPVLTRLLHDPDKSIQIYAANVFQDRHPQEAETAGVYKMFPALKERKGVALLGHKVKG
jgi:hypothetical protein